MYRVRAFDFTHQMMFFFFFLTRLVKVELELNIRKNVGWANRERHHINNTNIHIHIDCDADAWHSDTSPPINWLCMNYDVLQIIRMNMEHIRNHSSLICVYLLTLNDTIPSIESQSYHLWFLWIFSGHSIDNCRNVCRLIFRAMDNVVNRTYVIAMSQLLVKL